MNADIERLRSILPAIDMDAAEQIAGSMGAALDECPHLVRALQDVAIVHLFTRFRSEGEGYRNALTRTAQKTGLNYENTRYRLERLDITT